MEAEFKTLYMHVHEAEAVNAGEHRWPSTEAEGACEVRRRHLHKKARGSTPNRAGTVSP